MLSIEMHLGLISCVFAA